MTNEQLHTDANAELSIDAERVRGALATVRYPGLGRDLVSFGMVKHVSVCGDQVRVQLALRTSDATIPDKLRVAVTDKLRALGASLVTVDIVKPDPVARSLPAKGEHRPRAGAPDPWAERVRLGMVKHVIAVGAGKGGVGKSTVAVNLALSLARRGLAVGILDADIYGPSVPMLLGIEDGSKHVRMTPDKHIVPVSVHGISLISFGFFIGEGSPAIWRGPMVSKAVKQFARGVEWPALDVLVVDLPPGTGDIPLSLVQAVELSGAVVVTQPPRLAGAEARKAGEMFAHLDVRVLGVVENMTGAFGAGGGATVAQALNVPLLGSIPFDAEVVFEGDAGTPTLLARGRCKFSVVFNAIARQVEEALGWSDSRAEAES
ncbi:MAG TPA: P-loop NTPase [Gemmatimonadaceae bacterium]|nr:P-loop NTPase [Gemmatimonadaceae bacterium]